MTVTVLRPRANDFDIDVPLDGPPTPRARRRQRVQAAGDLACGLLLVAAGAVIGKALTGRR